MKDKSLNVLLVVLFGISGTAVLALAWLQPMSDSARILSTFIGSIGLLVASIRAWMLKSPNVGSDDNIMVKVELKDKP